MPGTTPRVGAPVPLGGEVIDVDVIAQAFDAFDDNIGGFVCTSATRPATPFVGQIIYETDTKLSLVYTGAAWQPNYLICTSATRPNPAPIGTIIYEADTFRVAIKTDELTWQPIDLTTKTWVPTISNAVLGAGSSAIGYYMQVGKNITWACEFVFAAGSSSTGAQHEISLPTYASHSVIGTGYVFNGAWQNMLCQNLGTAKFRAVVGANIWGNAYAPIAGGNSAAFSGVYIAN